MLFRSLGRDVLSRLIYGARISIAVGFLAVFVAGALGVLIAVISGVYKGWVEIDSFEDYQKAWAMLQ